MTTEQQRIAIAEACGTMKWGYGLPTKCIAFNVPDYLNDLNACHEFEKILSTTPIYMQKHAFNNYAAMLCEMCKHEYNAIAATAPQRCEAFLKTINKWKDENDR